VRKVNSKRAAARVLTAVVFVGLGLAAAFFGSTTTAPSALRTDSSQGDFRRLDAGGATTRSAAAVTSTGPEIKHGARVAASEFNGNVGRLPHARPDPLIRQGEAPELESPAGQKEQLPGATEPLQPSTPASSAPAPAPNVSFKGLDFASWGAGHPPDTVGDVGPDHFVQAVNTSIGIFGKAGGAPLAAFTFDTLWSAAVVPSGTACDTDNQGDPTVVYDPQDDRWIVADFAFVDVDSPPYYECVAVSKTSNPVSGGWYLYAIRADDPSHPYLPDYLKLGIWPDGLYMTANEFCFAPTSGCSSSGTYKAVRVWAFNRSDLESGVAVRNVVFDLGTTAYFSLLPSNMRTAIGAPPAGRVNLLVSLSRSLLAFEVWKFHVDYSGSGSTFTGPTNVSQAFYADAPDTVPTPGNQLDSLNDRLMMQAQYANIGGAESLWVNHTVACCGPLSPAGIQWAQIDVTGGTVATTPFQQQLYPSANDGLHRWMGSLAVDDKGDMALGYSVANATTNPDIRYAGRLAKDPLNTLPQTETTMLSGVTRGTQTGNCGATCIRWGDYSAMTIDPDGCRFWYTQEYYKTTGLNWQTRIGSFAFPSCVRADQTITFDPLAAKAYGDADFAVAASASSGLAVSFEVSGNCTVSGSTLHLTGVGSCTVTASQSGDSNNNAATDVSQSFTIAKANQTLSFAALAAKTFGDGDFSVGATASSGLPVSFAASGSCSLAGATVHITSGGSCTVTASQPGDSNYNAAPDIPQTFTIAKASQTITFGALPNKTYGAADFGVSATTSSGLAVSFTASGRCSMSGSTVHTTGAGSCTVTASQPGSANFEAATSVSRTFSITRPPCRVPKIVGKRLAAAKSALTRGHCATGKVRYRYSSKKDGAVISQSRSAGRVLPANSKINLVVSRGRRR
jgi:hypothetical protein